MLDNTILKLLYVVVIIVCLMLLPFLLYSLVLSGEREIEDINVGGVDEFYVGVDVAFHNLDQIKELINRVDSYSNFFLVGTTGISHDEMS